LSGRYGCHQRWTSVVRQSTIEGWGEAERDQASYFLFIRGELRRIEEKNELKERERSGARAKGGKRGFR